MIEYLKKAWVPLALFVFVIALSAYAITHYVPAH
jgi:hypothetical protein